MNSKSNTACADSNLGPRLESRGTSKDLPKLKPRVEGRNETRNVPRRGRGGLRSTAQNIKVTRHKTRQRTTSRDKRTDKNDREASWEKDGSSSATYHRKEKASDCNRYSTQLKLSALH
ncbi:hypothetical protein AVEN_91528-1 [Araneus ventricosus]|uniref:Uncharacterized protein n=1 Tax=Araneus ventricosus TaxID=182803 RepID=A0A4Y2BLY0_ARAVE|nr:hypothetical protein AVEN_91528-1 [Araneus ventricosus]